MDNDKKLLDIKDLVVEYTSAERIVHAVNGIDLYLERGETLGLVGETGAGKTTTALSIMGLLPPRTSKVKQGSIAFDGKELLTTSELEMQMIRGGRISMIFQDPMTALNPFTPIGEQIEETLRLHNDSGVTDFSARTDEILKLIGINPERKKDYPHQFSGGMKQRVIIAMALACSPELLIADEPTTALDVTIQAQVLELMANLKKEFSMGMILITHDLGIIAKVCDRVAVMYAGEIVETGTFEDFFLQDEHHPYTDGLFGCIPDIYGDAKRLTSIKGLPPNPMKLPAGCKFHPRCEKCTAECSSNLPPDYVKGSHSVKCHLFKDKEGYHARDTH